jgi:hypothetical protein
MKRATTGALLALAPCVALAQRVKPRVSASTAFGDNVIAHVADGAGWQTSLTILNLRSMTTSYTIDCYADDGSPQKFPFSGPLSGLLPGNGSMLIKTAGTAEGLTQGWCFLDSPNDVAGFAIFTNKPSGQEVSVPATPHFASQLILAFDNTNGYTYGVALVQRDDDISGAAERRDSSFDQG